MTDKELTPSVSTSHLIKSKGGRRYGYRKDAPSSSDKYACFNHMSVGVPLVDLESFCGPVKNQGDLGACTAFAGTGMREFLARKYERGSQAVFSPLFLYYKEREFDGDLSQGDTGSEGRTSVHCMNEFGVCLESQDGYDIAAYQEAPTEEQLAEALQYRAGAYHKLANTVQDMKNCLASGYAFVVGFTVYESFESKWSVPGYMPLPKESENILGGHEVLFIGYDDSKAAFKVRNSWGSDWGLGGNFLFPYTAVDANYIVQDAWIQHMGKPWVGAPQ
jgi:C1A family cysteine protease